MEFVGTIFVRVCGCMYSFLGSGGQCKNFFVYRNHVLRPEGRATYNFIYCARGAQCIILSSLHFFEASSSNEIIIQMVASVKSRRLMSLSGQL